MLLTSFHWRLLKRIFFLLPLYLLIRLGFFFFHHDLYSTYSSLDIFYSFLHGFRFDIAALCLINAPLLFFSFIPSYNNTFLFFERILYVLLNSAGIIVSINDFELFNFTGKRLSLDFFLIADDILSQLPQVMLYYWPYSVFGFLLLYSFYFFDKKVFHVRVHSFRPLSYIVTPIFLCGLFFIGIRGGLQSKSINIQSAFVQGSNELGQLVLNTPYHFIRSLKSSRVGKPQFIDDSLVSGLVQKGESSYPAGTRRNVVLIVLESFSLEYMEEGYTPFLSELAGKGVNFSKHLANGRKSIEALPSILCSIPSLLSEPFPKSTFQGNRISCFSDILKKEGYTNYFFHAGGRGTMGFDAFTRSHGFDKYLAKEDYPNKGDYDGTWGIYDGPYLQYVGQKISEMPRPFLAGIFTLSSHQPYSIPLDLKGKFQKGSLEIHESIGYADWALREFFNYAKKQEWYENTLFVITADHTSKLKSQKFNNLIGHYRVPLVLYAPNHTFDIDENVVTQHSDIPHTVLDFLGIDPKDLSLMGRSVLSPNFRGAFNFVGGNRYVLVQDDHFLSFFSDNTLLRNSYDWETGKIGVASESDDSILAGHLQYFFNSLISNNFDLK